MGCAQRDTEEDNDVKSEEGITPQKSPISLHNNIILNKNFLKDVEVSKDEKYVDSFYMYLKNLDPESGVVKHFFPHFNN